MSIASKDVENREMMTDTGKIVAIIPARYASTRLMGKPLIDLCGKPMIRHVYEQTARAKLIDCVIVATDDIRIFEAVEKFGGRSMLTPSAIPSGSDRIAFVAKELDNVSIVVNVQGDEPLIVPEMIDEAVLPLTQNPEILVSTLVKKILTADELKNPNVPKVVVDKLGYAMYFSRSPIPYLRDYQNVDEWFLFHDYYKHIGLYVYRKEVLEKFTNLEESLLEKVEKLEQLRILENGIRIKTVVTKYDTIPVDTIEDVGKVRLLIEKS